MTDNQILSLIEKLINKTKSRELSWLKYDSANYDLKPLKTPIVAQTSFSMLLSSRALNPHESFVCKIDNGFFFLLVYQDLLSVDIDLCSQTIDSAFSQLYASTTKNNDTQVIAQLKRLYNLVDASLSTSTIDMFVENFLKN